MNNTVSSIHGRYVQLQPLVDNDFDLVFKWRSQADDLHLWYQRPEILTFGEFQDDFRTFINRVGHIFMTIGSKSAAAKLGMVYSYKVDYLNGHVYVCTYVDSAHRNFLYGAESTLLFINHLFTYYPFRKIYTEIYGHNSASINNACKAGFQEEGRLRNHRWYADGYKDMVIFALYRDAFYAKFSGLISQLTRTNS